MPFRLTRLDKLYKDNPLYFITFSTHQRQRIVATPEMHAAFQKFCLSAKERQVFVGRYVLMPDHLHFFVCMGPNETLEKWIKSLKNSLSKHLRERGIPAPHWQKCFFDHVLRSEDSYEEKWIYVRQNPVRHELVTDATAWPYQGEIAELPFD